MAIASVYAQNFVDDDAGIAPMVKGRADIARPVDAVDLFLDSRDGPRFVEAPRTLRPRCVWMQLGIRHDGAAEALARAGIRWCRAAASWQSSSRHAPGE